MLDRSRLRIDASRAGQALLSTIGLSNLQEGQPMVADIENGVGVIRPSTGAADSIFAGFSIFNERVIPSVATKVERLTAVGTTLTLSKSPNATSFFLKTTGGTVLAYNVGVAAGQYSVTNNVVTLNAAQSGNTIDAVYQYNLTVNEAIALFGTGLIGPSAVDQFKSVDVVTKGEIFTDQFDHTVDWATLITEASGTVLKARANGLVSINGNGAIIRDARVIHAPSADLPFLGISII